jgi:hypothetical protein
MGALLAVVVSSGFGNYNPAREYSFRRKDKGTRMKDKKGDFYPSSLFLYPFFVL